MAFNVAVGIDGKLSVSEASKVLGCSVSNIGVLIKRKKILDCQKINGFWYMNAQEIYKLKESGEVKSRPRGPSKTPKTIPVKPIATESRDLLIQVAIPREQAALIEQVLRNKNLTFKAYLESRLNELYTKVKSSLELVDV